MLNFEFTKPVSRPPELAHDEIYLRPPEFADFDEWSALREKSRAHLTRWEPDWRNEDIAIDKWRMRLRAYERQFRARTGVVFHICQQADKRIVGGITLSDIRRHASYSATLGYWIGAEFLRRGYGISAVETAAAYAFDDLELNRIEAACQPDNKASRTLLEQAGFREEGLARQYLHINGEWRDHVLYSLLADDFRTAE